MPDNPLPTSTADTQGATQPIRRWCRQPRQGRVAVPNRTTGIFGLIDRFLADPRSIGAIVPSSPRLARAMASHVGNGAAVLELGAGNGAITRHLPNLRNGSPLLVFEQDRLLAQDLRNSFEGLWVIEGLFHESICQLEHLPEQLVIVSSIPFKSIPDKILHPTVKVIGELLLASPRRKLVQYTYFSRPPFESPHPTLHWQKLGRIWANLPPATLWELRARPA